MNKNVRELHRGSSVAAGYTPHQFLITFPKEVPFVSTPTRNPTREWFHVFAHEFWHYWHNLSTFSGAKQFMVNQQLLALFSRTLGPTADGRSVGASVLGDDQYTVSSLLAIDHNVEGDLAPQSSWITDGGITFEVVGAAIEPGRIQYGDGDVPGDVARLHLEVVPANGNRERATMLLGTAAIEESIALLVEEHVAVMTPGAEFTTPPWFPYRLLEQTLLHLVGRGVPPPHAAGLGTLALLTTHPGPALLELGRRYRLCVEHAEARIPVDVKLSIHDVALTGVIAATRDIWSKSLEAIEAELVGIVGMHKDRGLLEQAARYFLGQASTAFQARRQDPIFDVRAVFVDRPIGAVLEFQREFASCDVLQQRDGDEMLLLRDDLVRISEEQRDEEGFTPSVYARTFQAQQSFLHAHIDRENGTFLATSEVRSCCPYFTSCGLPLRRSRSDACQSAPWEAFDRAAPSGCWYSLGVAGSLGPVKVRLPTAAAVTEREQDDGDRHGTSVRQPDETEAGGTKRKDT